MPVGNSTHHQLVGLLYRDHRGWLLGWLRRSVNCPQGAEALRQDTFVLLPGRPHLHTLPEPRALPGTMARARLSGHSRRPAPGSRSP